MNLKEIKSKGQSKRKLSNYINLPKTFSIFENPEECLEIILREFPKVFYNNKKISLRHEKVKNWSLGSEVLLGIVAKDIKSDRVLRNKEYFLDGDAGDDLEYKQVLASIGLIKDINAIKGYNIDGSPQIHVFEENGFHYENPSADANDKKKKAVSGFIDYLDECLEDHDLVLSEDAADNLEECLVVDRINCRVLILSIVSFSIYGCGDSSLTTRIGNTDVCIPNHFMNNIGSPSSSNDADEAPSVYMSMSIDPPYIQQDVPAYSGALGEEWSWRYKSLHITITDSQPYNGTPPKDSNFDTFFSKPNPNLVGYRNEPPFVSWDAFEIQPDNTRKYWGICFDFSNPSLSFLECKRALIIENLEFMYSVSGSNNIDLYPAIDKYLTEKVTKEWRCDSSS